MSNQPLSEQRRLIGNEWADLDSAARMLEETKSAVLSKMKMDLGDIADNKAEKQVRASKEWHDFITAMVTARTLANRKKNDLKYIEMKFFEWQTHNANSRAEMRM